MPWSWECKTKFIKQNPVKPTERSGLKRINNDLSPTSYVAPQIFCGKGYSLIKRAPAFTFGRRVPLDFNKPLLTKNAPELDVSKIGRKGGYKVKYGIMSDLIEKPRERSVLPGPASYAPQTEVQFKRPPAYTMRPAAQPPSESKSHWTPPPNMYLVDRPMRAAPAYSMGIALQYRETKNQATPQPGYYDPKYNYTIRNAPGFTFGARLKELTHETCPGPNAYCDKKVSYPKRSTPKPSFGIRHSRYIGKESEFLKPSDLSIDVCGE